MSGAGQESVEDSSGYSKNMIRHYIDRFVQKGHAVLIIEDIDAEWYQALAARFPGSLDVRFLAQHVLRQGELRATYDSHEYLRDGYTAFGQSGRCRDIAKAFGNCCSS